MKYYAVKIGKVPGIYMTWAEASSQVKGFPKAVYKSFTSKSLAEEFMIDKVIGKIDESFINVYTDGSYKNRKMGYACLTETAEFFGPVPNMFNSKKLVKSNNVAELYAIYEAFNNFEGNLNIHTDSIFSVNILQNGYETEKNLELVTSIKELVKNRKVIFTHVYGHKGTPLNERADFLANIGREAN